MTTSAPASGAVKSMRKISLLAMLLAALPAAAYDVNGVGLGARESEVKKRFPSIHCKELEWKSLAAERRCDDSKVAFGGAEVRITLYLRKDAVQAFDVRFDARDTERIAAFAKSRYGAPVSETRDNIEIPGKAARQIFAPSPGLSPPSILTQWIVSVFARPASCAARVTFAPLTGQTNRIPLPGCSGVRRAKTSSRSAPALASASSLSAAPPARSTSIADQTSAFVTLIAMVFPLSGMQPANLLPCGRLWLASAQVAAVGDVDHRAVQDHRRVEGEPADGLGDLFRPPGAPGIGIPHELLDALGLRLPEQLGFHRPRRHRIHLD